MGLIKSVRLDTDFLELLSYLKEIVEPDCKKFFRSGFTWQAFVSRKECDADIFKMSKQKIRDCYRVLKEDKEILQTV